MRNKLKKIFKFSSIVILIIIVGSLIFAQSCSSATYPDGDSRMKKVVNSTQYKDGKFVNINPAPEMNFLKMAPVMWEFLTVDNNRKPKVKIPTQKVDIQQILNAKENELKITWIGHSSQIINIDGKIILTDPVYENKTVFMGPSRYNGDVPLFIEELPEIDLVLITHNHYDHLNKATIEKIHHKVKMFYAPLMVGADLESFGVPREKIVELDWWEEIIPFENFLIAFAPTQHFSGRGLFDRDETLWGSYVIKGLHHKIYFSGDSGYFEGFKLIGEKYGPFDYTMMECGAYNKKWYFVHMFPEESVQAHLDLKGKILQPMHWGTFDLALHAWYDPMIRASKTADSLGVRLSTPIVGQTIKIDENLNTERWWEPLLSKMKKTHM
jgi:L-ascorbate metabolism protein UlaG (beta-lactamase superfamily)